jgi:hypothetical protein
LETITLKWLPLNQSKSTKKHLIQSQCLNTAHHGILLILYLSCAPGFSGFSGVTMVTTAKTPSEINKDRFHLLVGICMESLCSSRSTQSNATVSSCLHAFYSLLDSPKQRVIIGTEQVYLICLYRDTLITEETRGDGDRLREGGAGGANQDTVLFTCYLRSNQKTSYNNTKTNQIALNC